MKNIILAGRTPVLTFNCPNHSHNAWELVYYSKGAGCLHYGESVSPFNEGDLVIIPPNIPHYEETHVGYETFIILFSHSDNHPETVHFFRDENHQLLPLVELLYSQYYTGQTNRKNICEALLNAIEQFVISLKLNEFEKSYSSVVHSLVNVLVDRFYLSNFQVKDAIKNIPYSEDYFRRIFKRETGKSPTRYLNDLRVKYASQLLEESTLSIKRIAHMSGFGDPYYFSRIFKLLTGKYPKEYREAHFEILRMGETSLSNAVSDYIPEDNYDKFTVWNS